MEETRFDMFSQTIGFQLQENLGNKCIAFIESHFGYVDVTFTSNRQCYIANIHRWD
jgi:hypothetical protein